MKPVAVDCLVIGGGIAGLWLLDRLVSAGYGALLVERDRIGAGQTGMAQGIIHGGLKYALDGVIGEAATALSDAPARWRQALAGQGDVDLSGVGIRAERTCLWFASGLAGRLLGRAAEAGLASRPEPLAPREWPAALRGRSGIGAVLALPEPVLDIPSLLALLAARHRARILRGLPSNFSGSGLVLLAPGGRQLDLKARRVFVTAGAGAEDLAPILAKPLKTQRRPLHMLMAKGPLPDLFGHAVGLADKPRLTVTSHRAADGAAIWYLGGQLAEEGVALSPPKLIAAGRKLLAELLEPEQLAALTFATVRVDRAEARGIARQRPNDAVWGGDDAIRFGWPAKLALAPRLADLAMAELQEAGIAPSMSDPAAELVDWPRPEIAPPPWDETAWN